MDAETDTLPEGGTDNARALSLDEAARIDIREPEEETAPQEPADPAVQEAEAASADDAGEGAPDESVPAEPMDTAIVTVNGEKIAMADLKSGYLRQADYSRKTQDVANRRREVESLAEAVTKSAVGIADFLAQQIPDAPDPMLAQSDPGAYVRQKALHDAAMARVQGIFAQVGQVKDVAATLTHQQQHEMLAQENARLAQAFPETGTAEGRKAFFTAASTVARDLGYSADEIASVTDHRMFALAHYAAIGLKAEQAKAKAAQKVAHVPPVAPPKRQKSADQARAVRNRDAMRRLARTGSLEDAMAIDFD